MEVEVMLLETNEVEAGAGHPTSKKIYVEPELGVTLMALGSVSNLQALSNLATYTVSLYSTHSFPP